MNLQELGFQRDRDINIDIFLKDFENSMIW